MPRIPFIIPLTETGNREVRAAIATMSDPGATFYVMVVLSTTIAAFGLLADSTAVVIGAMLVAPLMGPIFGIALAVSTNDHRLFRSATIAELFGAVLVVLLAGVMCRLFPHAEFGREILVRTQPNLYDLVIAYASGLAGAYALVDKRLSPALPGVAIATALVPPLTAAGLCLAEGQLARGAGALLLFVVNFLAIETASSLVFRAYGLRARRGGPLTFGLLVRQFGIRALLIIGVGVYLGTTLVNFVGDRTLQAKVNRVVADGVARTAGARVDEIQILSMGDSTRIMAVVTTPRELEPVQIADIQSELRREIDGKMYLVVRNVISRDIGEMGIVYSTAEEARIAESKGSAATLFEKITAVIRRQLTTVDGATLVDIVRDGASDSLTITAVVRTPRAIDPPIVAAIVDSLRIQVPTIRRLLVRSLLTRDADADRFVYDRLAPEISATQRILLARARASLDSGLAFIPGTALQDVRVDGDSSRTNVVVSVTAPSVIQPGQVALLQARLAQTIDSTVHLVVHTTVAATASATGFVSHRGTD